MNRLEPFKVGDTVYIADNPGAHVIRGTIMNIESHVLNSNPRIIKQDMIIQTGTDMCRRPVYTRRSASSVYPTAHACALAIQIRNGRITRTDAYKMEIKSVKDLMNFIFSHDGSDKDANQAALQKACELFGFTEEELLQPMKY